MYSSPSLNLLSKLLNAASLCPTDHSTPFYKFRCIYFIVDAFIMMSGAWYCIFFEDFYTGIQAISIVLGALNAMIKVIFLGFSRKLPRIMRRADRIYAVVAREARLTDLVFTHDSEIVNRCSLFFKFMTAYFPTSILAALYKVHFGGSESPLLIGAFYFPKMPHYTLNIAIQVLILLPVWLVLTIYVIFIIALTSQISSFLKCLISTFEDQKLGRIDRKLFQIHSDIIMLVQEMNHSISSLFLLEIVILSPLQSCFCAYGTIVGLNEKSIQGYYSVLLLIFSFALPFALTYSFQGIINESERLHDAIFWLKWHERSSCDRKDVVFLAMQTNRGLEFHYRREFTFNMERFCEYLQCVLSFVTLIKHLST